MHYSCDSVWLFLSPFSSLLLGVGVFPGSTGPIEWQWWIRHLTSPEHSKSPQRAAQGLETTTRSSSSYLAMHPGSRSPTSLSWPQLSLEIHPGSRTLEAPRGNHSTPARGGACSWWWWWWWIEWKTLKFLEFFVQAQCPFHPPTSSVKSTE